MPAKGESAISTGINAQSAVQKGESEPMEASQKRPPRNASKHRAHPSCAQGRTVAVTKTIQNQTKRQIQNHRAHSQEYLCHIDAPGTR